MCVSCKPGPGYGVPEGRVDSVYLVCTFIVLVKVAQVLCLILGMLILQVCQQFQPKICSQSLARYIAGMVPVAKPYIRNTLLVMSMPLVSHCACAGN